MRATETVASLRICAGLHVALLLTNVITIEIACAGHIASLIHTKGISVNMTGLYMNGRL